MTVLLHGRRPLNWPLPFHVPALCSTPRGERVDLSRRPSPRQRPDGHGAQGRSRDATAGGARTGASLDGAEHRGTHQFCRRMSSTSHGPFWVAKIGQYDFDAPFTRGAGAVYAIGRVKQQRQSTDSLALGLTLNFMNHAIHEYCLIHELM